MGNSLPLPCVCHCYCHDEVNEVEAGAGTAVVGGGAKKRRRRRQKQRADGSRNVCAARPGHVVVPVVDDAPEDGDGGREQLEAWPECRVEPAGHGEGGGARVRIVMRRKDVAQLVARLEQRGAGERNATAWMEEVVGTELAGFIGNGTMMSPCRDAWRPRLSIIPENC